MFLIKYSFVSSFLRECLSNNFPFSFSSFDMDGGPQAADFIKVLCADKLANYFTGSVCS